MYFELRVSISLEHFAQALHTVERASRSSKRQMSKGSQQGQILSCKNLLAPSMHRTAALNGNATRWPTSHALARGTHYLSVVEQ